MADTPKDEKTEDATDHKLDQSREKGQIAYSTEAVAAFGLVVAVGTFMVGGGFAVRRMAALLVAGPGQMLHFGTRSLDNAGFADIMSGIGKQMGISILAMVVPMTLAALAIGFAQAGFRISPKAIAADITKLDPIKGAGRMLGARGWTRTGLAALKIVAIGSVFTMTGFSQLPNLLSMGMSDMGPMIAALGQIVMKSVLIVVACVVVLALVDYIFQRMQFAKEQRMSKQEVKEEHKQTEGDPHLKARIRAVQREMATGRMMEDVKDATAVITNPTHFAVAVQYPRGADGKPTLGAPMVVAKGVDFLALNIKKVAREAGITCHEDRPLARAMYARVEIGQPIPEDLYAAVATVLAAVWRAEDDLKKRGTLAAN